MVYRLDGEFDETNIFDTSPNGLLATIFYTVEQEVRKSRNAKYWCQI